MGAYPRLAFTARTPIKATEPGAAKPRARTIDEICESLRDAPKRRANYINDLFGFALERGL